LPQALRGNEDEVVAFAHELAGQGAIDHGTIDLRGPVPVEFIDGLEAPEVGGAQAPLERAPLALLELLAGELLEDDGSTPASLGGAGEEVVEIGRGA